MSLINQMLTDLEARRGGALRSVDHALDGLQSAPIASRPKPGNRRLRVTIALVFVLVALLGTAAVWWWRNQDRSGPPTLPELAKPSAETAVVPPPAQQGTPVILADKPVPAVVPEAPLEPPALPAPAPEPAAAPSVAVPQASVPASQPMAPAAGSTVPVTPPPVSTQSAAPLPAMSAPPGRAEPAAAPPPAQAAAQPGAPASVAPQGAPTVETPGAFHRAETAHAVDPDAMAYQQALREAEEGSLGTLAAFVASRPKRFDARQRLALAQIKAADRAGAEATLREGLALRPNDPTLSRLLGHLLMGANQVESALEILRAATPPLAKDPEFHALLAAAEQRTGAHAMAAARYKSLLQLQPTNGSWLVGLGISLAALGDARSAARLFNQALDDRSLAEPLRAYASRERLRLEEQLK